MDALVMCGGRGTRFEADVEKPLYEIGGRPMVDRVLGAVTAAEHFDAVVAVTSPNAPETRSYLRDAVSIDAVFDAPGDGYIEDLEWALERVYRPTLTVAADLPLLDEGALERVLAAHDGGSMAVTVPASLKRRLRISVDGTRGDDPERVPTGVNVIDGEETEHLSYDPRLAINVNRRRDAAVAEALLETGVLGGDAGEARQDGP